MSAKLSEFLKQRKIDPRRLLIASSLAEKLQPEDRRVRLIKRQRKAKPEGASTEALAKPRSGRPLSKQRLDEAVAGRPVPGPTKQRVLRAVNRILSQRKEDPVDLRALF